MRRKGTIPIRMARGEGGKRRAWGKKQEASAKRASQANENPAGSPQILRAQ
jgi:hypothetical protein